MRENVRAFVESAVASFACRGPVYEFGSYQVEGQDGRGDLREVFPGATYVGCDCRPGPGVDRLEDVTGVRLPNETAGTILCVDTLEHVFDVPRAVAEMIRLLRPGGLLLLSVPMDFRIHAYPDDYWRLTPSCVARLLRPLTATVVGSQGVEVYPHTVFGLGCKSPAPHDFAARARRVVQELQSRLAQAEADVPLGKKFTERLRAVGLSKGERRRRHEHFRTRFAVQVRGGSADSAAERTGVLSCAHG